MQCSKCNVCIVVIFVIVMYLQDIDIEMKRTEQMLTWLERGSEKQFTDFCNALVTNNQLFIVREYLTPKTIPERRPPESSPPVILENPGQSQEIHKDPEIRQAPEGEVDTLLA